MPDHVEYITHDGETWAAIAVKHYGDAKAFGAIVRANPHVPLTPRLAGGLRLVVPVVEPEEVVTDDLPPWKR